MAIDLTMLFDTPSGGSVAANLLNTIYGQAAGTGATSNQDPVRALQQAEQNQANDIATTAAEPQVQRDIAAFQAGVQSAKSPQDLLQNPAVMKVLLTANGLGADLPYTALAQQALLSNVNDPNALANALSDTNWKAVAQTYDFANKGLSIIQNPKVLSTIANAYAEVTWRQSLDAATPGLSNALTFRAEASGITSVDQILGDPIMRQVVTTALGIPLQIAYQDLGAQEKAITTQLDITQFKDPKFVESFVQRYLIATQQNAAGTSSQTNLDALAVQAQGLLV